MSEDLLQLNYARVQGLSAFHKYFSTFHRVCKKTNKKNKELSQVEKGSKVKVWFFTFLLRPDVSSGHGDVHAEPCLFPFSCRILDYSPSVLTTHCASQVRALGSRRILWICRPVLCSKSRAVSSISSPAVLDTIQTQWKHPMTLILDIQQWRHCLLRDTSVVLSKECLLVSSISFHWPLFVSIHPSIGHGITTAALQYLIHNDVNFFFALSRNCTSCVLDIAVGQIVL